MENIIAKLHAIICGPFRTRPPEPAPRAVAAFRETLAEHQGATLYKVAAFPRADGHFPQLKTAKASPSVRLRIKPRS